MPIHEIRVSQDDDPLAAHVARQAEHSIGAQAVELQTTKVYYLEGTTTEQATLLAEQLLADPATQTYSQNPRHDWNNRRRIEVAPLPGVMNTDVEAVTHAAELLGIKPAAIQSGIEYYFAPGVPLATVRRVTGELLVNGTVEQVQTEAPNTLVIEGQPAPIEVIPVRNLNDDQLVSLSKDRKLALSLAEMKAIQQKARKEGRDLKDGELEYLAAAWSEHCCHKTFNTRVIKDGQIKNPFFARIKEASKPYFKERGVLSAFHDNSGVWKFFGGKALCIKLETHNSPMNLEPYGGSATGTGGVLRDILATGKVAKVINSMHMLFLAPLGFKKNDVPPGCHTPENLLIRGVAGVGDYGNRMGVPTNNGSFHVHPNYRGKSSVLVGSMGIMPETHAEKGIPQYGDLVIAAGGRTGRDGIHGATFSSESADSNTVNLHSGAVQIGDPITEKKVFDALLEASERGLIRAVTDCGAAGFASAIGEMGEDIGISVDLKNAPLKYPGLSPWEIFLSESQERMVMAVAPSHHQEVMDIFAKHNSEATVLGAFGTEGDAARLQVSYGEQNLIDLDYEFIKGGIPNDPLEANWVKPTSKGEHAPGLDWQAKFEGVLAHGNVCSKESIVRQYDHEVQGTSAIKSYGGVHGDGPNNAAIIMPILGEPYAVIQAHGSNPALCDIDPARGSIWAYAEAMSNYVATGGNPDDAIIVNNYISATPNEQVLGALDASIDALVECVHEFRTPIISGKDSLSSTYKYPDGTTIESPYNLIITIAGNLPDVRKTVSTDIKKPGSTLVLIGRQDAKNMAGSIYADVVGPDYSDVPEINLPVFHKTTRALYSAIQSGGVLAAHDVSEGGVAVTISEMLFGGDCGADLNLSTLNGDMAGDKLLFNETAGCFVVEVEDDNMARQLFGDIDFSIIGQTKQAKTISAKVSQADGDDIVLFDDLSVNKLKATWKQPMQEIFA